MDLHKQLKEIGLSFHDFRYLMCVKVFKYRLGSSQIINSNMYGVHTLSGDANPHISCVDLTYWAVEDLQ